MTIKTKVYKQGPSRFDMCGQQLPTNLSLTNEVIGYGLAVRLHKYGINRLKDAGFYDMVSKWQTEVYTIDADELPSNRTYCIKWINSDGGYIELAGILTNNGWPSLDHGWDIGHD